MAYDQNLENRIDLVRIRFGPLIKKKMFGDVGYMVNGNMCFGIHKDFLVVRTSVEIAEKLLQKEHVSVFDITGRPMKGWFLVGPEILKLDSELLTMLETGLSFAVTLPEK